MRGALLSRENEQAQFRLSDFCPRVFACRLARACGYTFELLVLKLQRCMRPNIPAMTDERIFLPLLSLSYLLSVGGSSLSSPVRSAFTRDTASSAASIMLVVNACRTAAPMPSGLSLRISSAKGVWADSVSFSVRRHLRSPLAACSAARYLAAGMTAAGNSASDRTALPPAAPFP